ncbi:MAG: hypothetical protein AAB795_02385 [Patescibacteria group bacterium]
MNGPGKNILVTAISGSSEGDSIRRFQELANSLGKKTHHYALGARIENLAIRKSVNMSRIKILNSPPDKIKIIRRAAIEEVRAEAEAFRKQGHTVIWNAHASFYHRHAFDEGIDPDDIRRLSPDVFVNYIDDVESTTQMMSRPDRIRQWRHDFFPTDRPLWYPIEKTLDWQSVEVMMTRWAAGFMNKPFYVLPTKANPVVLYRFLYEPWRVTCYFGMPLTFLHGKKNASARRRIDALKEWLEYYVTVIDPRYVEPISQEHLRKIFYPMYDQIPRRDLWWLIPPCNVMVAFYPKRVASEGMSHERREFHETSREVFTIYPSGPVSPFFTFWTDEEIFHDEKNFKHEFLKWLGSAYLRDVKRANMHYKNRKT